MEAFASQAYSLYRLQRLEEALTAIEEVGQDKAEAALQLEAQVVQLPPALFQ
jgi:hypothetical protein